MMEKLKQVYSPTNSSDIDEVRRVNTDYLSDIKISDDVLKTVVFQTDANTRSSDESRHKKNVPCEVN